MLCDRGGIPLPFVPLSHRNILKSKIGTGEIEKTIAATREQIQECQTAVEGVLANLQSLKDAEAQWMGGRFGPGLQRYLNNGIANIERKLEETQVGGSGLQQDPSDSEWFDAA